MYSSLSMTLYYIIAFWALIHFNFTTFSWFCQMCCFISSLVSNPLSHNLQAHTISSLLISIGNWSCLSLGSSPDSSSVSFSRSFSACLFYQKENEKYLYCSSDHKWLNPNTHSCISGKHFIQALELLLIWALTRCYGNFCVLVVVINN